MSVLLSLVALAAFGVGAYSMVTTGRPLPAGLLAGPESAAPVPTAKPTSRRPPAAPVLETPIPAKPPSRAGLARSLESALSAYALGSHVGIAVRDVATGTQLYESGGTAAYIPASTTKVITAAAVLSALGPQHRFATSVVEGTRPGEIVLVGGGDPLLAGSDHRPGDEDDEGGKDDVRPPEPASIQDLAARTAKELKAAGRTKVQVRFDDSLFGEQVSPTWEPSYVDNGYVARVSALWVDQARLDWPEQWPRSTDPAHTAAEAFTRYLADEGINVTGELAPGQAAAKARRIAAVESPPLAEIAEYVLQTSDNDGAEVLARHVAVAEGRPATFEGASAAMRTALRPLGVDADQIELYDGSGLSRSNRLSPTVLTQVLTAAAGPDHPELRPLLTGLPVAGWTGTLDDRFGLDSSLPGAGVVRAKTGTLSGVSALAGVVTTKDGAVLAFAVLGDELAGWAEPDLDRIAAILAGCGC